MAAKKRAIPNFDELYASVIQPQPSSGAFEGIEAVVDQVITREKRRPDLVTLDHLRPNPHQPRKEFDEEELDQLGDSILEHGLLEPLVVRESLTNPGYYDIACGERRWRAMRMKGIREAEAIILDASVSDTEMAEIALIENVQRKDLTPYELAESYQKLREQGLSIEQIAAKVKKKKAHVDDHLAIMRVPLEVRQLVREHPDVPLRTVRDLGNVPNEEDRKYLIAFVSRGELPANSISQILQAAKRVAIKESTHSQEEYVTQKNTTSVPEEQERTELAAHMLTNSPSVSSSAENTEKIAEQLPTSTPSVAQRPVSSTVELVTLEHLLSRDKAQIYKIYDRLQSTLATMSPEARERVRNSVDQWHTWMSNLLEQTQASAEA